MATYQALFKRYKEQKGSEVFSHFGWNAADGENWETPFEKLAHMAKKEDWNFRSPQFRKDGQKYPILMNYLNYTFLRIQELGLIAYSDDGSKSCFNTGLQTKNEKDIYATFFFNQNAEELGKPQWTFYSFADSYSEKLKPFNPLPEVATYISYARDLVFETGYEIEVNTDHIVDHNKDRLPANLREERTLSIAAIEGSTRFLKEKIRRNYKVAIPHWYSGRIQLLLPLNLTSDYEADLALVADRDDDRKIYRIRTALSGIL